MYMSASVRRICRPINRIRSYSYAVFLRSFCDKMHFMSKEVKTGPYRTHLEYPQLTMYQMFARITAQYPDAPAYEFFNRTFTYEQVLSRINRAARAFVSLGVKMGDAVTVCMPNLPQTVDAFYALNRIGAIANMIHPLSAEDEIVYYLNLSGSRFILVPDMFYEKVKNALKRTDHDVTVLCARIQDELPLHLKAAYLARAGMPFLKYPEEPDIPWQKYLRKDHDVSLPPVSFDKNRTSVILYSGGTTGRSKGVCLSDLNFNALALQAREAIQEQFRPGLTMLACMPMFHGFGLGINIHAVLIHGVACILMPNFNIRSYTDMLKKKKPSLIAGVPTIFEALLHAEGLKDFDMSFLKGVFCGGDTLSTELKKKVDAFLHEHHADIQIREGYGLTECVTASCLTPKNEYRDGSIGLAFPDTVYDIVAPGTDESLPFNEEGEIVLKGPTLMLGYLHNEEETKQVLRRRSDGDIWLYTGDIGCMDEDGYVYFRRRMKRMIVTNGYNVYPDQLEEIITKIPGVLLSCVIGRKDERRGQRVCAYVVKEKAEANEEAIRNQIMAKLEKSVARYALPKEIEFREDLPRTLVGKVAYHVLEEEEESSEKMTYIQFNAS